MPHYLQSVSNTMNPSRIRRCIIKEEEIWRKNTEEKELNGNFVGCEFSQPANFHRLRNFITRSPVPAVDCFLTRLFVVLYKFSLHVILSHV